MTLRYKTYDDPETLRKLYWGMGLTQAEIANEFDSTRRRVQLAMDRYDIPTRGRGRSKSPPRLNQRLDGYEAWEPGNKTVYVHQLLAISGGAEPDKVFSSGEYVVHHKNGIRWDNRHGNIQLKSKSEHIEDHWKDGDMRVPKDYTDDELLEWIDSFKKQLGVVPSASEMDSCPGPHSRTYINRFGSWGKAVRAAGYKPRGGSGGGDE